MSKEPLSNKTDTNIPNTDPLTDPSQDLSIEEQLDEAKYIAKKQMEISEQQLILNDKQLQVSWYNLISTTLIGISIIVVSVVLAIFTGQLSVETDALKDATLPQVRSYISIQSITANLSEHFDQGTRAAINITLKADGYTPASSLFANWGGVLSPITKDNRYGTYGIFDTECLPSNDQEVGDFGVGYSRSYNIYGLFLPTDRSGSNPDSPTEFYLDVPHDDMVKFKNHKALLVVKGAICFRDVFKKQRFVRFCRAYDIDNIPKGREAVYDLCSANDSN